MRPSAFTNTGIAFIDDSLDDLSVFLSHPYPVDSLAVHLLCCSHTERVVEVLQCKDDNFNISQGVRGNNDARHGHLR